MYLPQWAQQYKDPNTEIKKVKGHFYKYKVESRYNKEKKRSDTITLELLGKITETQGFIPSYKHLLRQKADISLITLAGHIHAVRPQGRNGASVGIVGNKVHLIGYCNGIINLMPRFGSETVACCAVVLLCCLFVAPSAMVVTYPRLP